MKWIKSFEEFEAIVEDAKRRNIPLLFDYDGNSIISIYSESKIDETTVEFDYQWYLVDTLVAILSGKFNIQHSPHGFVKENHVQKEKK